MRISLWVEAQFIKEIQKKGNKVKDIVQREEAEAIGSKTNSIQIQAVTFKMQLQGREILGEGNRGATNSMFSNNKLLFKELRWANRWQLPQAVKLLNNNCPRVELSNNNSMRNTSNLMVIAVALIKYHRKTGENSLYIKCLLLTNRLVGEVSPVLGQSTLPEGPIHTQAMRT